MQTAVVDQIQYNNTNTTVADTNNNNTPSTFATTAVTAAAAAVDRLYQALSNEIPYEDKKELLEALHHVPELVQLETDPIRFYINNNNNNNNDYNDSIQAAKRLALYWKLRKDTFLERAYLPMNILGTGTMNMEDINVFSNGICTILPNDMNDATVCYLDKRYFDNMNISIVTRKRICFYILHLVTESSNARTKGFRIVMVLDKIEFTKIAKTMLQATTESMPGNFLGVTTFCINSVFDNNNDTDKDTSSSTSFFNETFASFIVRFNNLFINQKAKLHISGSQQRPTNKEKMYQKMIDAGYTRESIPNVLGGCWGEENFNTWFNNRKQIEEKLYKNYFTGKAESSYKNKNNYIDNVPNTHVVNNTHTDQLGKKCNQSLLENLYINNNSIQSTTSKTTVNNNSNTTMKTTTEEKYICHPLPPNNNKNNNILPFSTNVDSVILQQHQSHSNSSRNSCCVAAMNPYSKNNVHQSDLFQQQPFQSKNAENDTSSSMYQSQGQVDISDDSRLSMPSSIAIDETKINIKESLSAFQQELAVVPYEEKYALDEALRLAPTIVNEETDSMKFLRVVNFDVKTAARRLCRFWRIRKELFGDRAFLPMFSTGEGALSRDDVISLTSGSAVILPKDSSGRDILFIDNSRVVDANDSSDVLSRIRGFFYLLTVLSENVYNTTLGVVCITIVDSLDVLDPQDEVVKKRLELWDALPVKCHRTHLVLCPPRGEKNITDRFLHKVVPIVQSTMLMRDKAIIHQKNFTTDILTDFITYGLTETGLPAKLGGNWKYEQFLKWHRQRSQYEDTLRRVRGYRWVQKNTRIDETEEDREARKRRRNIIASRQKRERRKTELDTLQQKHKDLLVTNSQLKSENTVLEKTMSEVVCKLGAWTGH